MEDHRDNAKAATWAPTPAGKAFTTTPDWSLTLIGSKYEGHVAGRPISGSVLDIQDTRVKPGAFWAIVVLPVSAGTQARLDGLPNADAKVLHETLAAAVASENKRRAAISAGKLLSQARPQLLTWASSAVDACKQEMRSRGWLSSEFIVGLSKGPAHSR